jgi:hypothetical protein
MTSPRRTLLVGVVAIAAIAGAGYGIEPTAASNSVLRSAQRTISTVTLVCPDVTGTSHGLRTTMAVTDVDAVSGTAAAVTIGYVPLLGARAHSTSVAPGPASTVTKTTSYGAVALTAHGPGAARVAADQVGFQETGRGRGLSAVGCVAPATDWWFAGADGRVGRSDTIFVANPADQLANITVGVWGPKGAVSAPAGESVPIAPRSSALLRVSDLAPDVGDLLIHVRANSGDVAAALFDQRTAGINPLGTDWIPATLAPTTDAVVAGYIPGAGARYLLLANPESRDATTTLRVITRTGNFQPAGHQSIVVPAGKTVSVDLGPSLGAEAGALLMHSDQSIVAEGVSIAFEAHRYEEVAWHPAQAPMQGTVVLPQNAAPFHGRVLLQLTAPAGPVRVRLSTIRGVTKVVAVPAGRTLSVDVRSALHVAANADPGPLLLQAITAQPVYASRMLFASGAHGPLVASEVPSSLPRPLVVPAIVEDLRAATP